MMTNDEAIKWLKVESSYIEENVGHGKEILEAYDMAIKALEQQPCEDCISRKQAILETYGFIRETGIDEAPFEHVGTILRNLPSVTPKPIIGHWIEDAKTYYEELNKRGLGVDEYTPYFTDDIACSECLAKYSVIDNETQFFKYCPNCGAKMEVDDADSN